MRTFAEHTTQPKTELKATGEHMIDSRALAEELQQARLARLAAEAATSDVEDMIREVQHLPEGGRCFAWVFTGLDEEMAVN